MKIYLVIFTILVLCSIISPLIILTDNNPPWPSKILQVVVAGLTCIVPLGIIVILSLCQIAGRESRLEEKDAERHQSGEV